jgi:hypothetical protein
MRKVPALRGGRALRRGHEGELGRVRRPASLFSFSYSYTEIAADGAKARVRARRVRLQDGRLASEAFEGELDRAAYDQAAAAVQRAFVEQTASLLAWPLRFLSLLPGRRE